MRTEIVAAALAEDTVPGGGGGNIVDTPDRPPGSGRGAAGAEPPGGEQPGSNRAALYGCAEALLLNLDESLGVHTRSQLFGWTQGLLKSVLPHDILLCALRAGQGMSFRVDGLSTMVPDSAMLGDLLLRDAPVLPELIAGWKQRSFRPAICSLEGFSSSIGNGPFGQELARLGATEIVVHGTHDVDGEAMSLFAFAGKPGSIGDRELYLAELIGPFLHAALVRSQTSAAEEPGALREGPVGAALLTEREREILHWVYLGKSNAEIGAILVISPLTVKNHVQKILRKLNVVNRAQAVGKALDARIIRP